MLRPTASEARALAQFIVAARVSGRYHDILLMASNPLRQRVHFLALPDRSNLAQLLQWDLPPSEKVDCLCRSAFNLEDYLHAHWSPEQFHLPVPPGLAPSYTGLTLSTWDDVVSVYVQQTDRETLQAMVLLGQQGHCKVVMILRAEKNEHEEKEREGEGEMNDGNDNNNTQDKRREHLSPILINRHNTDRSQSTLLSSTASNTHAPSHAAATVWKYHDLLVQHDESEAWVSNLTKGWDLLSEDTLPASLNLTASTTIAATRPTNATSHDCSTNQYIGQPTVVLANSAIIRDDEDDDDDDDYWGQYGDAEDEGSSGDGENLAQDQACLDDLADNSSFSSSSSSTSGAAEADEEGGEDSDSDDDYWGQYGDEEDGGGKSESLSRRNSGDGDEEAAAIIGGVDDPLPARILQPPLEDEKQENSRLMKQRSDSLSTQVDPNMLSSILQMLVSKTVKEEDREGNGIDTGDQADQELETDARSLDAGVQVDSSSLTASPSSTTTTSFLSSDIQQSGAEQEEHNALHPPVSLLTSDHPSALFTSSTHVSTLHRPTSHNNHQSYHSHHEPPSPTSISNSPLYPAFCQPTAVSPLPPPLLEQNGALDATGNSDKNNNKRLHVAVEGVVQQACQAGFTKHQLLHLIEQQFSAHEGSCQHH